MSLRSALKKIKKLYQNPDLFFFDLLRKRIENKNHRSIPRGFFIDTKKGKLTSKYSELRLADLDELLKNDFGCIPGAKDGIDANSYIIQEDKIPDLLEIIDICRFTSPANVTIYTLDGSHIFKANNDAYGLSKKLTRHIKKLSNFTIEISSTTFAECKVLQFFVADFKVPTNLRLRSEDVWIKSLVIKCVQDIRDLENGGIVRPPIDAVYTWVDSSDPKWLGLWRTAFPDRDFDLDRFSNHDELKFSMRSLNKYAPWLNKIYIVSNCSPPPWLSLEHPKIFWVEHSSIFPEASMLPTFNSHAIESCLHRISGLSEKFIYLNDDFFLGQPCLPGDFFDEYGRSVTYFEQHGFSYTYQLTPAPDYIRATANSSDIIFDKFLHRPRRLHKHVPYALSRSIIEELELCQKAKFEETRKSKIRSSADINITSFLFQHYAHAIGRAINAEARNFMAKPSNIRKLLNNKSVAYKFICINDGGNSAYSREYKESARSFFLERYSEHAPWEHTITRTSPPKAAS